MKSLFASKMLRSKLHLQGFFGTGPEIIVEGAWVLAGQVVSAIGAVVSIRILTELMAPDDFGELALLVGIAALALGVSVTPKLQAIMRYFNDWSRGGRTGALRRVGAGLVVGQVALVAIGLAGGWSVLGPMIGAIWYAGLLVAALLIVDSLRSFELALFSGARRQQVAAMIYAADAWARLIMAIGAIHVFGASAPVALGGYVLGSALVLIVLFGTARLEGKDSNVRPWREQEHSVVLDSEADLRSALRRYALPLMPLAFFGWISATGDRYVIGGLLGMEQVGFYGAAYALVSRPFLMLSSVAELTIRPVLQNAISTDDASLISAAKNTLFIVVAGGSLIGVVGFVLLSKWIAGLILAEEYRSAAALMPWLALGYAFYVTSNVFSRFCYAFDDTNGALVLTVAGTLLGIITMVPAVVLFGLYGAAVAMPVGFCIQLVLSNFLARRAERAYFVRRKIHLGTPE